jgi:hypothetical protein
MKITEILRISNQNFPKQNLLKILEKTTPHGELESGIDINYTEEGSDRVIILTHNKDIVAYAGFITRLNGKVWQAKNLQVYPPYNGRQLGAKIYKYVKEQLKKSIQSDIEQSSAAEILWTKTLPAIGLTPRIFDTETDMILDQAVTPPELFKDALAKMYNNSDANPAKYRYTWILEKFDNYQEHCVLKEAQLLMPYKNIWYNFKEEK